MHTHRFRVAYNLAMGLADPEGWVPKLLVRACRGCDYAEALHGSEQLTLQRNRVGAWEVWVDGTLHSSGDRVKWKHT